MTAKTFEATQVALHVLEAIRATNPELIADNMPPNWGMNKLREVFVPTKMAGQASPVQTDESGSSLENFPFPLEFSAMNDLPEIGVSCQDVFVTNPFYDHGMTTKVDPLECWGISESHAQFIVDLNDELGEAVEDAINAACARLQNVGLLPVSMTPC